ncbi:hypothetical protein [Kitasatospora sp. McL0602]|uniref:hypothetical protein n=1 Tax=Kitasatospora sp. McL0602 TaxID=3439530 RepID=UPI003F89AC83
MQPSPSLLTEEGRAALPPRPASGRPSAGLGIQYDPSGAVVTGGPRTWRFSGSAGTRLGEILLGQAAADDSEAELLHTLGLWEAADPELASAQRESFADPDTLSGALRFCGRWAPTTRRHPSGAAAVEAWRQLRPVVVGESALARALIRELALSWPATVPEARELLVVVDGRPEPHESRAQLPVTTRGTTVAVGPWTEPGVSPCPPCATARLARAARPAGMAVPAPALAGTDIELQAALVVAELVHTAAGVGRGARPGLVVEHTPGTGRTRILGITPTPGCTQCAGGRRGTPPTAER